MARTKPTSDDQERLIFDAGAVLALAKNDGFVRSRLDRARELLRPVVVPAPVLAEVVRGNGPRDAPVNRALKAIGTVATVDEERGRLAGKLLGTTGSDQTIDAMVVAEAILGRGGLILTTDPKDLTLLAGDHPGVSVRGIH